VLLPLAFAFGALILRWAPLPWQAPLRFALFVSASVVLVAIWGLTAQEIEVQPGNRQVLPNDYPRSVALLLAPVWLLAIGWGWTARRRVKTTTDPALHRSTGPTSRPPA
jgi:hypothetical protein